MPTLSIILITKNEAANIRECLESVRWADEIVVVDSGSSDGTQEIAREFTQHVYLHTDWPGFGPQKNRALDYATGDWVLSIDADERVTPESHTEILAAMRAGGADGFLLPRLSQFCGKFVYHSGWYPDYVLRLFRRERGRFSDSLVHETVLLEGDVAKLRRPMLHYSYRDEADVVRKIEHYSQAAARQMFERGKTVGPMTAALRGTWAFVRTFLLRLGFLDGVTGLRIARMNAATTYRKYQLLRAMRASN